jgi:hypothetical protein
MLAYNNVYQSQQDYISIHKVDKIWKKLKDLPFSLYNVGAASSN